MRRAVERLQWAPATLPWGPYLLLPLLPSLPSSPSPTPLPAPLSPSSTPMSSAPPSSPKTPLCLHWCAFPFVQAVVAAVGACLSCGCGVPRVCLCCRGGCGVHQRGSLPRGSWEYPC